MSELGIGRIGVGAIICGAATFLAACSGGNSDVASTTDGLDQGTPTLSRPEVGALVADGEDGATGIHCTATLVTPDIIVTAAHCVTDFALIGVPLHFEIQTGTDVNHPIRTPFGVRGSWTIGAGVNPFDDIALIWLKADVTIAAPAGLWFPDGSAKVHGRPKPGDGKWTTYGYGSTNAVACMADSTETTSMAGHLKTKWSTTDEGESAPTCAGDSGGPHFDPNGFLYQVTHGNTGDPLVSDYYAKISAKMDQWDPPMPLPDPKGLRWVSVSGAAWQPYDAVSSGNYTICRARFQRGTHIGKVVSGACDIGWFGSEVSVPNYAVLAGTPGPWLNASGVDATTQGILAGEEYGKEPRYICRAQWQGQWNPGKLVAGSHCYISWGGKEIGIAQSDSQILTTAP